ncbi:Rho1 guanine nucleotide exchange factor 3 [Sphaceloma murrayae]|uniref:Rho1 guanine nucleotide exchange factor 3 n=1 Tax=Sphaceloma murrayae TaxID=2082308 RepID=A0A2K1QZ83_9PEZI|nr:Rho1 guanine nucleotide exchange factor 3 [Sphaceloma murrayae]
MSYQQHGYYGDPPQQHGHYQQQSQQDDYAQTSANGYSQGNHYQPGQQWANGNAYPTYTGPNGALQSPSASQHSVQVPEAPYSGYYQQDSYQQADQRQRAPYNPQLYAQTSSQYPQQAYGNTNPPYTPSHSSYNPAAFSGSYAQNHAVTYQQNYYQQQTYNPSDYASSTYGGSPQPSQNHFHSPQGGSDSSHLSPRRDTYSSVPPPVPPRPTSSSNQTQTYSTYSTYSQPAPQMASTYTAPSSNPPYPDYSTTSTAMPGYEDLPPDFSTSSHGPIDDLHLPSPPAYTPFNNETFLPNTPQRRPSVSPLHTPEAATASVPPPPPAHGASSRTSPSVRHPQSRPLPGPPEPDIGPDFYRPPERSYTDDYEYHMRTQDELFDEVENAIMNAGSPATFQASSPVPPRHDASASHSPQPLFGSHRRKNDVNGRSPQDADSDAEALLGLEMMRIDSERAAQEEKRRQSGTGGLLGTAPPADKDYDSDNYANVDMGLYGGGYEGTMSYGGDPNTLAGAGGSNPASLTGSIRRPTTHGREMSYDSTKETIQSFPAFRSVARVDSGGTGGLVDPSQDPRRPSVDDGDAYSFTEDTFESSEPPDMFFHPGDSPSMYRPLPPPPSSSADSTHGAETPATSASMTPYLSSPSVPMRSASQADVAVPRFISLREHTSTPPIGHPTRSKTDADPRKPALRTSVEYRNSVMLNLPPTPAGNTVTLDLPSLPSKRFNVNKLGASDFKRCDEPWALSSLNLWLRQIANPDQVTELKESMIREALVALFTNKVPTMNITDAEVLSGRVIREMYDAGTLRPTEEWVRLAPGPMSGVIFQLTQGGCYSPTLHDHVIPGRCYSRFCQRTLRKVNLHGTASRVGEDWATFYKLKKEDIEGKDKKEIERQNILHEIVQTEEQFMSQIHVLQQVYRDAIAKAEPPVLDPKRLNAFIRDVFGKIDPVRKANEDHLLAQLKYRQEEQGPFITGFSDIFRQWIRKAKHAYIEYAAAFPAASLMVRQELERSLRFRAFLDEARANKASLRLGLDTYLKAPITRLQRYSLLLMTVHKNMKEDSDEKTNLQVAIDEVKDVTKECDARVAEMQKKVDLADLGQKLVLRPGMQQEVELNLNHLGRHLIHQGSLQRMGSSRFNWVDCQVLLFDHYLIIAKAITVIQRGTGAKIEKYDVSRFPIPMDLLVLESTSDDAVKQSHYTRGLSAVSAVPKGAPASEAARARAGTSTSPSIQFDRTNTGASMSSLNSVASAPPMSTATEASKDSERILFPFRIKHLGRETYTLFAQTAQQRADWGSKIIEAKAQHAKSLYRQNAEPFHLRVMADTAFNYEAAAYLPGGKPIIIEDTPMDRAVKAVENRFKDTNRPGPICRAKVNCACSFTTAYPGKHMVAVGTDYGVYISEIDNPRGWSRSITMAKVTQIAVLEEFNVFLLISAGSLIAYHLEVVTTPPSAQPNDSTARRAPQKLSGTRDVGFFAVGKMKDRTLVFYKKRDGLSSTFKVLEPVYQKASEKKRSVFKRGTTDFFRDYDEFYIPAECSGINLFSSSLAVSTSRGFEVLTLDKKQTFSVPDLRAPEVANIATHIEGQNTLGMLRLSEQEFLLCYEKCAVYVNKHGDVSRSVIMNFVGRARSAALYGPYLVLFDQDFVEVRNAQNGRLKQIIAGRDVRCLDDGGGGSLSGGGAIGSGKEGQLDGGGLGAAARTVKVAMCHPMNERCQVVVELVLNEGLKE